MIYSPNDIVMVKVIMTRSDVKSFICFGFYVAFNTVHVISQQEVGRAEKTSTYSWSTPTPP